MPKKLTSFLIIACLLGVSGISQDYRDTEIISIQKNLRNIEKIRGMGLDLLMEKDGKIYIVASAQDLTLIHAQGIPYTIETSDFPPYKRPEVTPLGGVNGDFHSYKEVEQELNTLEAEYPSLVQIVDIGDSLENRNLYAVKISDNVQLDEDEAEVIFLGCHHAREWISVEVPLLLAKHLAENYASDSDLRWLLDRSEVWIAPLLNPDGLEYSIHFYRYWRKNRRDNGSGSFGVDLNRNYDFKWGLDNEGSSPVSDSNVYRGPSAFSEPESQAVRDLVGAHDFKALVSYHSYSQVILYPWGHTHDLSPWDDLLEDLARNMSVRMQQATGRVYEFGQAGSSLYLTNGDTTDWALGIHQIPAFTIELPPIDFEYGGFFNAEADIPSIFQENLQAALYLIGWAVQQHSETSIEPSSQNLKGQQTQLRVK